MFVCEKEDKRKSFGGRECLCVRRKTKERVLEGGGVCV